MELVLFDIDGTLVDTGGAGRRAINEAARLIYGRDDLFDGIRFEGATDRAICRAALNNLGRAWELVEINELLCLYAKVLLDEVTGSSTYKVYPGVRELVRVLADAGVQIGLGTGNIEAAARIKLERGGLNELFDFGGFGCDAEERSLLLAAGVERGDQRFLAQNGRIRQTPPWIIGDTPKDYSAARAIGAKVVLVATGSYSFATLSALGPDLCVETLEDPRLLRLI